MSAPVIRLHALKESSETAPPDIRAMYESARRFAAMPTTNAKRGSKRHTWQGVITQDELRYLAELQDAAWLADHAVHKVAVEIEARVKDGAVIEAGGLRFDKELKRVESGRVKG